MRAAAWLVITDAPSTDGDKERQPERCEVCSAGLAMRREQIAATKMTLPEMKKFAPTTSLSPISAVAIRTAELT